MDEKWNVGSALPSMASYNWELTVEFRLHQRVRTTSAGGD